MALVWPGMPRIGIVRCDSSQISPRRRPRLHDRDERPGRSPHRADALRAHGTPDGTAELFLRSVRAIRWRAAAQFVDDEALDRFETLVTFMAAADTTGEVRDYLTQTPDSLSLAALDAAGSSTVRSER